MADGTVISLDLSKYNAVIITGLSEYNYGGTRYPVYTYIEKGKTNVICPLFYDSGYMYKTLDSFVTVGDTGVTFLNQGLYSHPKYIYGI